MTVYLQRVALDEMNAHIEKWERRDAEIHRIMRRDPELNQRQRSILSRALRDPQATFRIAYHRTNHNVAYATARRDLVELEDRGYIRSELRGKALVFLPSEALPELVDQT
jgi:Fic family protein